MIDRIRARLAVASVVRARAADAERADRLEKRVIAIEELVAKLWSLPGHPGHKEDKEAGATNPGPVG
jgi:hypothetical protein